VLSITSDYKTSTGCPEPYLRRIAEAGFSHVHWCHQWNTDFAYLDCEVVAIEAWFRELGLHLTDLHGSVGPEKHWGSAREHERLAGVELVRNRVEMAARLGSDVVIMHLPSLPEDEPNGDAHWERMWRSLDAIGPVARACGVRIAIENGDFDAIEHVFARYGPDSVGLCYDAGHGNLIPDGLDRLGRVLDRLISIHLHDNDGDGDQHKLLFSGTVDWPRLAGLIARSPYAKPVSMESTMAKYEDLDETTFLSRAHEAGTTFAKMVRDAAVQPAG